MEKGLEIKFKVPSSNERGIVEALANLVGNEFREDLDIQWRIFDVKLADERFYKVCFTGHKMNRLHPHVEERVRKRFDELAHEDYKELMRKYNEEKREADFRKEGIKRIEEEYDLWQDNFWKYF